MRLVDAADYVITTEPAEKNTIVHWLGLRIACWRTKSLVHINLLEHDQVARSTEVLALELTNEGALIKGNRTVIGPETQVLACHDIYPENLQAFGQYVLTFMLERIPVQS